MSRPAVDGGGATNVDYTAIATAKDHFNDLAAQFTNTSPELGRKHDDVVGGAGEFRSGVETGAVKFLLGWREALATCSESAGLIAANMGSYSIDLHQVDVDQTVTVTI